MRYSFLLIFMYNLRSFRNPYLESAELARKIISVKNFFPDFLSLRNGSVTRSMKSVDQVLEAGFIDRGIAP